MKRTVQFTVAGLLLFAVLSVPAVAAGPEATLKPILQKLIETVEDKSLQGNAHRAERRAKIMREVKTGFDFTEMSKRVLGKKWRQLKADERSHFTALMTELLENVYIGRFEAVEGEIREYKVTYNGEKIKGNRAQVSTVVSDGTRRFPVHYIMRNSSGHWMVYDINIEGVSLVKNYQEQFRSILRTEKYPGLVKTIENKIASFKEQK